MNVSVDKPRDPNPAWWHQPGMRDALARRDVGEVFTLLCRRHHMTQRRIAELAGFASSEIYEIMQGRQVMAYDVLVRIATGLGIPRASMGLGYDSIRTSRTAPPAPALDDPGQRQRFITDLAGFAVGGTPTIESWLPHLDEWPGTVPAVISPALIATIRAVTERHRHLDANYGGGSCRDSALGYLVWARTLRQASCPTEAIERDLYRELSDLHNLLGWMSHDLGDHTPARQHLAQGLAFAQKARDVTLMADSYYRLGRVSIHLNDPAEALHLFQLGQIVATNSGCLTSVAILHANIAWAHAQMGNAAAVKDSLSRASNELGRADTSTAPQWTRFFSPPDLDGMAGVVHAALARHDQHRNRHAAHAIYHATSAIDHRDKNSRSCALDHVTAATGYALLGQTTDFVTHATTALNAAGHVSSRRLVDRLTMTAGIAAPYASRDSALGDVIHEIRTLAAA